jgi:hypothetical protein
MKWLLISISSQQEVYELRNSKEKLLTLAYHPTSGTLRISADDEKRVFLIGREGFLRRRTVLRNEYGVRMGQLSYDNNQENQGNIDVENEQFNYILENDLSSKATIYRNTEMLAVCELPAISKNDSNSENYDLLILMLCWYMSTSVRKQVEEFA